MIISFLGVIKIFSMFETKIYKYICYKLGMNEKIIAIQGKWYQVNKYAVSNREYYLSSYSFQIRGNKLFSNKQQYNLKIKKEDIFFEEKNKKIKICFLEDSSRIKIGSNYFKNAASLNIKSYSLIRKIKNRIYYRLENQSNIFTYPSLEHVLYLDTNKKEIVETRNKNRFGYKNKYSKKDLELKKIRYECKDDTLFFYNEQQKCIGRYERIKIDE